MRQPWRRCHRRQMDGFKSFGAHCSDRNSKACKQCTQSVTHSFPRRSQNGDSQQKSRSRRGVLYLLRRTWRRLRAGKPREVWACLALGVATAYVVHRLIGWGRVASSQRRRRCPKSLCMLHAPSQFCSHQIAVHMLTLLPILQLNVARRSSQSSYHSSSSDDAIHNKSVNNKRQLG